jgi:Family of unknown function (DUF5715)
VILCRKFVWLLMLALTPSAFGLAAVGSAHRHKKRAHKPTWFEYRVFVPSLANLLSQNTAIDNMGLPRIQNDEALREMIASQELVPITQNQYVRVCYKLETKRRFVRPWVDAFLQELGQQYYDKFGDQLQVNSAVRTVRTQMHLLRINHNAAPAHGEASSAHLAGVAVDLQRRGLTREQIGFIQQKLLFLANLNMVIVEEELKQPCFHIVVTGDYPYPPPMPIVIPSLDWSVLNGLTNPVDNLVSQPQ